MSRTLAISKIDVNIGQIPGLPQNPRLIRDVRFEQLKKSIVDFPEMLKLREIVVFPIYGRFVCIGGNMRFLACKDLGHTQVPVKVLPADFPVDKLKEFVLKDNIDFGEYDWDILANEFSDLPLEEWGLDLPSLEEFNPNLEPEMSVRTVSAADIVKTREELEEHFKDSKGEFIAVICPECAHEFYIKDE